MHTFRINTHNDNFSIGYLERTGNSGTIADKWVALFEVPNRAIALRWVNYLNGGDGGMLPMGTP